MILDVEHHLRLVYDDFISESSLELRVEPRSSAHQNLHSFFLAVGPPTKVFRYSDWNGNLVHHFSIASYHDRIEMVSRSLVETRADYPALSSVRDALPLAEANGPLRDFATFHGPVKRSSPLEAFGRQAPVGSDAPLGEQIERIGLYVADRLGYRPEVTNYQSTTDDVLEHGFGVCQDFAHVMLGLLRLRSIPCRYVSGYLHVEREDGAPSQSHAWVEVWSPSHEWVAYDPTHRKVPNERYVVVATGRSYDDVPPNRGIYRGRATETLEASVRTRPSKKTGALGLREEIGQIDVPIYSEVPVRVPARAPSRATPQDHGPDPQQQQQ